MTIDEIKLLVNNRVGFLSQQVELAFKTGNIAEYEIQMKQLDETKSTLEKLNSI
jgi:hypothetical protein